VTTRPTTLVAALETTSVARRVLTTALALAEMARCEVVALHVGDAHTDAMESLVAHSGVPLRHLEGRVAPALLEATEAEGVFGAVLGTREGPHPDRAVGSVTRYLLERTTKPLVLVPPQAKPAAPLRRLLVPLEGNEESSAPVLRVLGPWLEREVEVVVLHVFTEVTVPRMLDRPYRDMELLGKEFLTTHYPAASCIEMRAGPIAPTVAEVAAEHGSQLVVLSWRQEPAEGRARVLREVLEASAQPVMVLPAPQGPSARRGTPRSPAGPSALEP
jgi:hypothetical protein